MIMLWLIVYMGSLVETLEKLLVSNLLTPRHAQEKSFIVAL